MQHNVIMICLFAEKVLAGNERAAKLMAEVVHREESIDCGQELLTLGDLQISTDSVGIWIDPIGIGHYLIISLRT